MRDKHPHIMSALTVKYIVVPHPYYENPWWLIVWILEISTVCR